IELRRCGTAFLHVSREDFDDRRAASTDRRASKRLRFTSPMNDVHSLVALARRRLSGDPDEPAG
ncbi:MAG TPA: hypothetical protein VEF36_13295, partial [Roseiarcus sp.]|nr:hypothetical protein [Roseiarcus sp.]